MSTWPLLFQKEGIKPHRKPSKTADEDLREHLRQSLAVITGQLRQPSMQNKQTNQHSPIYASTNRVSADLFPATNQQSGPEGAKPEDILQKILSNNYAEMDDNVDWSERAQGEGASSDEKSNYEYLKLLYDTVGNKKGDLQDYLQRYLSVASSDDGRGGDDDDDDQIVYKDVRTPLKGRKKKRGRRHVGPHDEGGLQRLISTGKSRADKATTFI